MCEVLTATFSSSIAFLIITLWSLWLSYYPHLWTSSPRGLLKHLLKIPHSHHFLLTPKSGPWVPISSFKTAAAHLLFFILNKIFIGNFRCSVLCFDYLLPIPLSPSLPLFLSSPSLSLSPPPLSIDWHVHLDPHVMNHFDSSILSYQCQVPGHP